MKSFIDKTAGGLSPAYYIRHFLFGMIIPAVLIYAPRHTGGGEDRCPERIRFLLIPLSPLTLRIFI